MSKPIEYRLDPSQWLEWVYARKEGDLSCFAPNKDEAVKTFVEHGFTVIDETKVTVTNRLLSDVLRGEAIQ